MPPSTFNPSPFVPDIKTAARVIQRLIYSSQSLDEIARDFGTDLQGLITWMGSPPIRRTLDALEAEAWAQTRAKARRVLAFLQLRSDFQDLP